MLENSYSLKADFCEKLLSTKQKELVQNFMDFKGFVNLQCKGKIFEESGIDIAAELN